MDEVKISPLARRLAEENSIDWRQIRGSGPEGRIVERDILTYLAKVMAGEISAPHQPDISEPPPIAGFDPGNMEGMMGASAALAKEGVDLGALMADHKQSTQAPAFQAAVQPVPVQPAPVQATPVQAAQASQSEDIFELDLNMDEPMPPVAQIVAPENSAQQLSPSSSLAGDVELVTDDDIPAATTNTSEISGFQLDDLEFESPVESAPAPIPATPVAQIITPPAPPVITPPPIVTPPTPPIAAAIEIPAAVIAPIVAAPIIAAVAAPAPAPVETVAPIPVVPIPEAAIPAAPTPIKIAPPVQPTPPVQETPAAPIPAPAATPPASSHVVADYFSQTVLRRSFKATALLEAQKQLQHLGHETSLLAFVARSAKRNLKKLDLSNLSVAKLGDNGLLPIATPQIDGAFKDLLTNVEQAAPGNAVDLAVLDASALGLDDLVLPGIDLLLSLGRFDGERGSLSLSGSGVSARQGAAFLQSMAESLENPIGLIL